jgi:putative membrane protein
MRLLVRVVANAIALWVTSLLPGPPWIRFEGSLLTLLLAGAIFGLFNAIVRPIALVLSIPALILTLGLFYFVLNGILLWVASWFIPGYTVNGVVAGMLGSLVIAIVNWALHAVFGEGGRD